MEATNSERVYDPELNNTMDNFSLEVGYIAPILVVGGFCLLLFLEVRFPLRQRKQPLISRILTNLCLSGLVFAMGTYLVNPAASNLIKWTAGQTFGLLYIVPLPYSGQFIAGFLLMDLTFYYWHRANHVFPLFRRFHNIHHIDPDLDVTTSFRFHLVEIAYSTGFRALQVILIGVTPALYGFYELIFQCSTIFHHSNVRLPIRFERLLNKVFVTPRMHGIHHSRVRGEMNSNYSVVFRWWDIIHKSLRLNVPQLEIDIGVSGYQKQEDNRLWNLLCLPFRRHRKSRDLPEGVPPLRGRSISADNAGFMLE